LRRNTTTPFTAWLRYTVWSVRITLPVIMYSGAA
jgi:hypothetical protein